MNQLYPVFSEEGFRVKLDAQYMFIFPVFHGFYDFPVHGCCGHDDIFAQLFQGLVM